MGKATAGLGGTALGASAEPTDGRDDRLISLPGRSPVLDAAQLGILHVYGSERDVAAGHVLFADGDETYDLIVLIAGTADIIEGYGHPGASVLASSGPSEFLGEIGMLTGQRAFLSAVATSAGRFLAVPVAQLRRVMAQEPGLSDLILRTFLLRHSILKLDVVHMPVLSSFGRMQDDEHVVVVRLHLWDTVSLHGVLHGHGMEPEHLPEHTHRLLVTGGNVHPYETVLSFEQLLQLRYAALLDPTVAKKTNVHWTHILKPDFALGGLSYGALPRRIVVVYVRRRHRAGLVNLIAGLLW